jgi:adenylate kinase
VQRDDDRPESIRTRMRAYEESTRPLTGYYERVGKLISIAASGTPEEVLARTLQALDRRQCLAAISPVSGREGSLHEPG